jgi:hypothetical protein
VIGHGNVPKKRERLEFAERICDREDEGGRGTRGTLISRCDDVNSDVKSAILVSAVTSSAHERRAARIVTTWPNRGETQRGFSPRKPPLLPSIWAHTPQAAVQ